MKYNLNMFVYFTGYSIVYAWRQNKFSNKEHIFYNKNAHEEKIKHAYQSLVWPLFIVPIYIDCLTTFERKIKNK